MKRFDQAIPAWPIVSIEAVTYFDTGGQPASVDVSAYQAQIECRPVRLVARSWPRFMGGSSIAVKMVAGFPDAAAINAFSPNLINAMRRMVAGAYEDRETGGIGGEPEKAAKALCSNLRIRRL